MWTVTRPRPKIRLAGHVITFLVFALCTWGIFCQKPSALATCVGDAVRRGKTAWNAVRDLRQTSAHLRAQLIEVKSAHALPRVRAEVGDQTIDVFGYEQGIALLNELNYTPRPIFQGYSAYTPDLIKANTAFYSSPRAPAYVLFKYQSIDDRYPALDDAGVLRQLLYHYKPLFEEQGYSLWKQIRPAQPIQPLRTITESLPFDSDYRLPAGEPLWLELEFKKSLAGWALNAFHKPPLVTIWVRDNLGRQASHRLIPSMSSTGFFVNPYLKTQRQVFRLSGGSENSSVVSFSLHVPDGARKFFQKQITCRVSTLPEVPRTEMDEPARRLGDAAGADDETVAQDQLITAFNTSTEVVLKLDSKSHFEGISPLNQTRLSDEKAGLRITATGTDPQLSLPRLSPGSQRVAILRIEVEAPADTGFQMFFLPFGVSTYGEHVINRFLRRGENTIYLALTDSQLGGGPLRLDPGMAMGDYFITSLEVRAVAPEIIKLPQPAGR